MCCSDRTAFDFAVPAILAFGFASAAFVFVRDHRRARNLPVEHGRLSPCTAAIWLLLPIFGPTPLLLAYHWIATGEAGGALIGIPLSLWMCAFLVTGRSKRSVLEWDARGLTGPAETGLLPRPPRREWIPWKDLDRLELSSSSGYKFRSADGRAIRFGYYPGYKALLGAVGRYRPDLLGQQGSPEPA